MEYTTTEQRPGWEPTCAALALAVNPRRLPEVLGEALRTVAFLMELDPAATTADLAAALDQVSPIRLIGARHRLYEYARLSGPAQELDELDRLERMQIGQVDSAEVLTGA